MHCCRSDDRAGSGLDRKEEEEEEEKSLSPTPRAARTADSKLGNNVETEVILARGMYLSNNIDKRNTKEPGPRFQLISSAGVEEMRKKD